MISVYNIKPKFQQFLKPVLHWLYKMKVTANMITWGAILLSASTGVYIWLYPLRSSLLILPIVLFIRMALNALDGMMARTYDMQSKTGEVLNELGDVISDFLLFFPLYKLFLLNKFIFIAFIFLSIINEFAGVLGKIVSGIRRYDGPMGKSDRAFVIGFASLVIYFYHNAIFYTNHFFAICTFLLFISTGIRIHKSLQNN